MRQPVPFGKYLLLDRISVGGMAEVFKAKSYGVEGFEKIIAIKRILPTMGEDRDFIKMFIDEAKIAGQLAHANICQIFELGRIDGSHFIAMEYIWGKDLLQIQNRLRKVKQQMPVPMACFTIAKVLEGLDYAHRKRDPLGRPLEIVHRDCSPQNVLVSYEGEVKVIDFGIAKATSRNSRTMAGVLKGKFGYMSPEQVRGLPLDRRSDIFALGTMLYECLTGERLFQGETDFSTLEKVRNVDIQNPRAINPAIPEVVERIILKALAKDVDDRYQWCSEMLTDLQQYLMSQDVVFTAKTLSGWLKDVFTGEIEKERQQLEQYKRVGRDGLIAGVPAAAAKLDVVEHLGEAGQAESADATQLGGPSFEDIEAAIAQSSGPALGSPASRGVPTTPPPGRQRQDDNGDFGEEAPTEIFGDLDQPPDMMPAAATPPPPAAQPLGGRPPKPPPGRPGTGTAQQPAMQQMAPQQGRSSTLPPQMAPAHHMNPNGQPTPPGFVPAGSSPQAGYQQPYGQQQPMQQGYPQQGYPQQGYPQHGSGPIPMGTPNQMPITGPHHDPNHPQQQPARTMLGMQNPLNPAAGNYGSAYRVTGQQPAYTGTGPVPMQGQGYPSQPSMYPQLQGTAANPNMSPYQQEAYPQPGVPVDSGPMVAPQKKKSSIGRDVAIGVAIAAVVLGGFLAVKFLVLDKTDTTSAPPSTTATIRLSLPAGVKAELFVDDKRVGTVLDGNEIPVNAGTRQVRLVGPNNAKCEASLELPGGKTTPLECALKAATPPPAEVGSGSAVAPAAIDAGSGSGSAATTETKPVVEPTPQVAITKPVVEPKPIVEPKPATTKPVEIKKPIDKLPPEEKPTKPVVKPTKPVEVSTKPTTTKPTTTAKPASTTPTPASGNGYLHVFSKPSAKVLIDGVETGKSTPVTDKQISLAPGKHKVTFVLGGDKFTYSVVIKAGATEVLSKDLPVQ